MRRSADMSNALRRVLAGGVAYLLAYALAAALTLHRIPDLLFRGASESNWEHYWDYYVAAGEPTAEAVGWFLLSAHRVPMMAVASGSRGVSTSDVFAAQAPSLYLAPALACFVAGALAVRFPTERAPVPVGVGAFLTAGYLLALVASAFLVRVDTGARELFPALFNFGTLQWIVVAPLYPLVFGSLGAFVGLSAAVPELRSAVE